MRTLVTGTAGFIGCEVALHLLQRGDVVAGMDNLNEYYDVTLKQSRLQRLLTHSNYSHQQSCISDAEAVRHGRPVEGHVGADPVDPGRSRKVWRHLQR